VNCGTRALVYPHRSSRVAKNSGGLGGLPTNEARVALHFYWLLSLRLESALRQRRLNWVDSRRFIGGQAPILFGTVLLRRLPTEFIRWSNDSSLNLATRGAATSELARRSNDSSLNLATRGAATSELARRSSDSSLVLATHGTTITEQARRGRW